MQPVPFFGGLTVLGLVLPCLAAPQPLENLAKRDLDNYEKVSLPPGCAEPPCMSPTSCAEPPCTPGNYDPPKPIEDLESVLSSDLILTAEAHQN